MRVDHPIVILMDTTTGGAGHAAMNLFNGLRDAGLPVECWHYNTHAQETSSCLKLDTHNHRPPIERAVRLFGVEPANRLRDRRHQQSLQSALRDRRPALIHLHNVHGCGLGHAFLRELLDQIPAVWTFHDCWAFSGKVYPEDDQPFGRDDIPLPVSEFWQSASLIRAVAPSRWMCKQFDTLWQLDHECLHSPLAIPPIYDEDFSNVAQAREHLSLESGAVWVGFCGGDDPRKGADLLLKASRQLPIERDVRLLTWGRPIAEAKHGFREIRQLGMSSDRNQLGLRYRACDLMACPSRFDNFPLVVLEAFSAGTPVLATCQGGTAEAVTDGMNGWVTLLTPDALACTLVEATNPGQAIAMRETSYRTWAERYQPQHEVSRIVELYKCMDIG